MEEIRGGPVGPFEDLEVIRVEAGMSTSRFCELIDMPERTWRRWQAKAKHEQPPKGPWPQPARDAQLLHEALTSQLTSAMPFCQETTVAHSLIIVQP